MTLIKIADQTQNINRQVTLLGIPQTYPAYLSSSGCRRTVSNGSQELQVIATDQISWLLVGVFYMLDST